MSRNQLLEISENPWIDVCAMSMTFGFSRAAIALNAEQVSRLSDAEIILAIRQGAPFAIELYRDECAHQEAELQELAWRSKDPSALGREEKPTPGLVYLIHDGAGAYKIGMTTQSLERRVWEQIQPKYPRPLELICYWETEDPRSFEANLHARFDHLRMNGEWFGLSPEDIEMVKSEYPSSVMEEGSFVQ